MTKVLNTCKQKYPNTTKTTYRNTSMIQWVTFKKLWTTVQENIIANIYKCIE
jgi:hypothetical protein